MGNMISVLSVNMKNADLYIGLSSYYTYLVQCIVCNAVSCVVIMIGEKQLFVPSNSFPINVFIIII